MKVAHFSDLHYCEKHLEHVDKAFGEAVARAIALRCDVGIISGDSFDSFIHVHSPAVHALIRRVIELANAMPVLILQGTYSHDRPGAVAIFRSLRTNFPIFVADAPGQIFLAPGRKTWSANTAELPLEEFRGGLLVSALPSLNPAEIRAEDAGLTQRQRIEDYMAAWAPTNRAARDRGLPTLLVSHGTVNGCVTESKNAMVSQDHEFDAATLFSCETSAVLLGHIHAQQSWRDGSRIIAYAGSITTIVHGHDVPTGFLEWDVRADGADFKMHACHARKLLEIDFDGPPDMAHLADRLQEARGAYARIRYVIDEEHRHSVDAGAIRQMFLDAGAAEAKVEARVNPVQRSRAAGIGSAPTTADKLLRWCELTGTNPEPLIARLSKLEVHAEPGTA